MKERKRKWKKEKREKERKDKGKGRKKGRGKKGSERSSADSARLRSREVTDGVPLSRIDSERLENGFGLLLICVVGCHHSCLGLGEDWGERRRFLACDLPHVSRTAAVKLAAQRI